MLHHHNHRNHITSTINTNSIPITTTITTTTSLLGSTGFPPARLYFRTITPLHQGDVVAWLRPANPPFPPGVGWGGGLSPLIQDDPSGGPCWGQALLMQHTPRWTTAPTKRETGRKGFSPMSGLPGRRSWFWNPNVDIDTLEQDDEPLSAYSRPKKH